MRHHQKKKNAYIRVPEPSEGYTCVHRRLRRYFLYDGHNSVVPNSRRSLHWPYRRQQTTLPVTLLLRSWLPYVVLRHHAHRQDPKPVHGRHGYLGQQPFPGDTASRQLLRDDDELAGLANRH